MVKNIEKIRRDELRMPPEEIIISITNRLPSIAKSIVSQSQDLTEEKNRFFFDNPDDPKEHMPKWHQWGIITHTKMSEKSYREEVPKYLNQWGILNKVKLETSEKIDNISKDQLLRIAILFHDLGKFSKRKLKYKENTPVSFSYKNHEIASGKIIRDVKFSEMLKQEYSLTNAQIEYVARCAELHSELDLIRSKDKKSDTGYNFTFVNSDLFNKYVEQFCLQHPSYQMEIGLIFFVDSLSKTEIRIEARTDQEVETKNQSIKRLLQKRGLNSELIEAVKQLPISFSVAEKYLRYWADRNNMHENT